MPLGRGEPLVLTSTAKSAALLALAASAGSAMCAWVGLCEAFRPFLVIGFAPRKVARALCRAFHLTNELRDRETYGRDERPDA